MGSARGRTASASRPPIQKAAGGRRKAEGASVLGAGRWGLGAGCWALGVRTSAGALWAVPTSAFSRRRLDPRFLLLLPGLGRLLLLDLLQGLASPVCVLVPRLEGDRLLELLFG